MKRLAGLLEFLTLCTILISLAVFVGLPNPDDAAAVQIPPMRLEQGAPPWDAHLVLPDSSDRIVHYTIQARLDTATNIVHASEILTWRNTTGQPQTAFPFHLYHNAFKNNRTTVAKEGGWTFWREGWDSAHAGYTNIRRVVWLAPLGEVDLTDSFRYVQPDDGNPDDQTVCEIRTPYPIKPGRTLRMRIEFETKQPIPVSRTGAIRDYHFVAQWFPKIGVWWKGSWNCHQFHAHTEFFADYGVYDVTLTVPSRYIVGASGGAARSVTPNGDGTSSHRFVQADIHDFAWVTSPSMNVSVRTFSHTRPEANERSDRHHALRDVRVILLWQPHHENLVDRYFDATFKALRCYGEWYGEYPYDAITVVDPANGSASGGMEYPTLFTGGGSMLAPPEEGDPEGVTVHEFGHQFWYGMVGNNEFEEAWLDEGFNTYSTDRTVRQAWPAFKSVRYYFAGMGADSWVGIPWVFNDVDEQGLTGDNTYLRRMGKADVMAQRGWEYNGSYGLNSYTKPALSLMMLERLLGEELMYRVMRTYHFQYRFKHPTSEDFIRTVNTVTGKDYRWFFDNTWYSSNLFDYAVGSITNLRIPPAEGVFTNNGVPDSAHTSVPVPYLCTVVVKREGEATAPVEVLIVLSDHSQRLEKWDGQGRWKKVEFLSPVPVERVIVDPDHKLVMDVDWTNNSRVMRPGGFRSLAARKYSANVLFWLQNYFEMSGLNF
jgi:hypothetical protein